MAIDYEVHRITGTCAKAYVRRNHYSRSCHNGPSPCYGLFDGDDLIGACAFATPCSENVRASVFGANYVDRVVELHRLHILDVTPHNTESWFISRCLRRLKQDRPHTWAVLAFSDLTEGHDGTIYRATNAWRVGTTGRARFWRDQRGRLRHPRQCGHNVTADEAKRWGWTAERREAKRRYLWLLADNRRRARVLRRHCLLIDD